MSREGVHADARAFKAAERFKREERAWAQRSGRGGSRSSLDPERWHEPGTRVWAHQGPGKAGTRDSWEKKKRGLRTMGTEEITKGQGTWAPGCRGRGWGQAGSSEGLGGRAERKGDPWTAGLVVARRKEFQRREPVGHSLSEDPRRRGLTSQRIGNSVVAMET